MMADLCFPLVLFTVATVGFSSLMSIFWERPLDIAVAAGLLTAMTVEGAHHLLHGIESILVLYEGLWVFAVGIVLSLALLLLRRFWLCLRQ